MRLDSSTLCIHPSSLQVQFYFSEVPAVPTAIFSCLNRPVPSLSLNQTSGFPKAMQLSLKTIPLSHAPTPHHLMYVSAPVSGSHE